MPPDPIPTQEEADDFREQAVAGITTGPVNTTVPRISGTGTIGATLSCSTGDWTNQPSSYSYQWKSAAANTGTNQSTYVVLAGDATKSITCVVTAMNHHGSAVATPSNAIAIP